MYFWLFFIIGFQTFENDKSVVASLLDEWHDAAAKGNLEYYFSVIHDHGHFLGTDKTEDWSKSEFYDFCKPIFEEGEGWKFKAVSRKIYFTDDGKTCWFNEVLDTWMGPCRGSGILIYEDGQWKIMQYSLTILVDNKDVQAYLKILDKDDKQE